MPELKEERGFNLKSRDKQRIYDTLLKEKNNFKWDRKSK